MPPMWSDGPGGPAAPPTVQASLLEAVPTPILVLREPDGCCLYANQPAGQLLGMPREEMLGRSSADFYVRPADRTQILATLARDGGVRNSEIELRRLDGSTFWAAVWLEPIVWEGATAVVVSLVDLTARRASELALRESEERYRVVVEAALEAIIAVSPADVIEDWNPAAEHLFGWRRGEAIGKHATELIVPSRWHESFDRMRAQFFATGEWPIAEKYVQLSAIHRDGHEFPVEFSVTPVMLRQTYFFVVNLRDITRRKQLEEELRHSAFHDALTGLPNRAMFMDLLGREVARARRNSEHRFALLYLDLDEFKAVNDRLGHQAGDQLLVAVADRLRACMRATDMAARLGGDEFAVLASDLAGPGEAERLGHRILEALGMPVLLGGERLSASASIGVAVPSAPVPDAQDVIRQADAAMYRAKQRGKRRVEVQVA